MQMIIVSENAGDKWNRKSQQNNAPRLFAYLVDAEETDWVNKDRGEEG